MNEYRIAVEGGGTRSTFSIVGPSFEESCVAEGPALHAARSSIDGLSEELESFIWRGIADCTRDFPETTKIGVALAGAGRSNVQKQLHHELQQRFPDAVLFVTSDVKATHVGAFNGGNGILVIAGTGSIVWGRKGGNWQRLGGYGDRMGDEGSGHLIGMEGLRAVGRHYDGQQSTDLVEVLEEQLDIHSRDQLIQWTYHEDHAPSQIAPLVIECADKGDTVCTAILERQTEQLAEMTSELAKKMDLPHGPLCCHGGLFDSELFYETFKNKLNTKLETIDFQMPQHNPRIGVCLLAEAV